MLKNLEKSKSSRMSLTGLEDVHLKKTEHQKSCDTVPLTCESQRLLETVYLGTSGFQLLFMTQLGIF
jgi:hypothetical protein